MDIYQSSLGFSIGTSFTGETNAGFIKASVSMAYEASYEKTWTKGESKITRYTFKLKEGDTFMPSMVHVDLECDAMSDVVYLDTCWQELKDQIWLEEKEHRTVGLFKNGQWCRNDRIKEDILKQDKYFDAVLDEDVSRGKAWLRPSSELNQYKLNAQESDVSDDQLVIRKGEKGHGGDFSEVWVCNRFLPSTKERKVRVPFRREGIIWSAILPAYEMSIRDG